MGAPMQMLFPTPELQRARGRAEVAVSWRCGRTRLDRLYQQGCAKAILPRMRGGDPEVVLINTAGGLTGGDRIAYALEVGARARLTATTQAAERVYRSTGETARVETLLVAGAAATLDWLPQETILFDAARLERRLTVEMAADATVTLLETLVLGRAAMAETLTCGLLSDQWRIRRERRLIHAEALRFEGDLQAAFAGRATLAGARALATIVRIDAAAERLCAEVRPLLAGLDGVLAAASQRDGVLVLRLLAAGHAPLRVALGPVLRVIRDAPLPRVWPQ